MKRTTWNGARTDHVRRTYLRIARRGTDPKPQERQRRRGPILCEDRRIVRVRCWRCPRRIHGRYQVNPRTISLGSSPVDAHVSGTGLSFPPRPSIRSILPGIDTSSLLPSIPSPPSHRHLFVPRDPAHRPSDVLPFRSVAVPFQAFPFDPTGSPFEPGFVSKTDVAGSSRVAEAIGAKRALRRTARAPWRHLPAQNEAWKADGVASWPSGKWEAKEVRKGDRRSDGKLDDGMD